MRGGAQRHLAVAALGVFFGFSLSRMGFSSFSEVHRMFTLVDLRLIFTFLGAVVVTGAAFAVVTRGISPVHKAIHRGSVLGGVLFGAGWAISGMCPTVVLVLLGEGRVLALATAAGVVLGAVLYYRVLAPRLGWDADSCG